LISSEELLLTVGYFITRQTRPPNEFARRSTRGYTIAMSHDRDRRYRFTDVVGAIIEAILD